MKKILTLAAFFAMTSFAMAQQEPQPNDDQLQQQAPRETQTQVERSAKREAKKQEFEDKQKERQAKKKELKQKHNTVSDTAIPKKTTAPKPIVPTANQSPLKPD